MLKETSGIENTVGNLPTLDRGAFISRHRQHTLVDKNAVFFRTELDSFRQEGFLHVLAGRIRQTEVNDEVRESLVQVEELLNQAIARRFTPNPLDCKTAAESVDLEIEQIMMIQSILREALENEKMTSSGSPGGNGAGSISLQQIYLGFIHSMNRILHAELPYVARKNDGISLEHGTVYLESQGLRIHIGPLSNRIGLHTAYVNPGQSFGHIHSSRFASRPNWEYHFVLPGQEGSHVLGDIRCEMDFANGDIISVPPDTPHGGCNHSTVPLELHFCAGGDIPWDYPPKDLSPYDVSCSAYSNNIGKVNGLPLKPVLEQLDPGFNTINDPRKLGGSYGVEFQAVVAGGKGIEWNSTGELVQVWSGDGVMEVTGTTMKVRLGPGDKCALLPGVCYRIVPSGNSMTVLKFSMIDF